MGDRGHNRHGPKRGGGLLCPFSGELGSAKHSVAWAEVYCRTNWRLHPSSPLATIHIGLKLSDCARFRGQAQFKLRATFLSQKAEAYLQPLLRMFASKCTERTIAAMTPFSVI